MLSRGDFIDTNSISALGLNATGPQSSKQSDLACDDYIADPEDIRTSTLSTVYGGVFNEKGNTSGTNVKDIKLTGGPATRPRKRRLQPVLRSETPIEECIPGAILDESDLMEEVRVTHRIIENDDWTVEEKRHVTRKLMKKKRSTEAEPTDDASHVENSAASGGYAVPAPPSYIPPYSASRGSGGGAAPSGNSKDKSTNERIDLAIQNALFNGNGYPHHSKNARKRDLPFPQGKGSRPQWPKEDQSPPSGPSSMENASVPVKNEEANVDLADHDCDTNSVSSSKTD